MAKKPRTEKQLANDKRLAEAAKARAAAKQAEKDEQEFTPTEVELKQKKDEAKKATQEPPVTEEEVEVKGDENEPTSTAPQPSLAVDPNLIATIVATVQTMQAQNPQIATATPEQKLQEIANANPNSARVSAQGVQGVVSRYPVEKGYYPDPTKQLLNEPSLRRYAMHENYIFKWEVDGVAYEKNGVAYEEPRFTLALYRRLYNDDGEPTGRAALVARNMLHEDQMTTRIAAHKLGLTEQLGSGEEDMRGLMDQVRYWRMQQWLFALFTPPKVETHRNQSTTEVIAGKVVEVFDTESLIDKESAQAQSATLADQTGVGNVQVPDGE